MNIPRLILAALFGATFVAPAAFGEVDSQSYHPPTPKTRAEVIADFTDWRAAGYDPQNDWIDYPENALRAGRIVAERRAQVAHPGGTKVAPL